jgi:hypothetical protein
MTRLEGFASVPSAAERTGPRASRIVTSDEYKRIASLDFHGATFIQRIKRRRAWIWE